MAEAKKLDYRCSPRRVFSVISKLNGDQKEVVKQMGFGALLGMKDCVVRRNLVTWLFSRFNTQDGSLEVHGKQFKLNSQIFGATIGVKDGVENLFHGSKKKHSKKKVESTAVQVLEEKLITGQSADMSFVRDFLLFIVSVFLMPNTSVNVAREVEDPIKAINDIAAVCRVNWASLSYNYLWKALRRHQKNKGMFVGGCIYFLQLFYCHHVVWKEGYVDRSLCPLNVWSDDDFKAILDWVQEHGGFESNKIPMIELQDGAAASKMPATLASLCDKVESIEHKMIEKEIEMVKFHEDLKLQMAKEFKRLRRSLSGGISSRVRGGGVPKYSKGEEPRDSAILINDPILANMQMDENRILEKLSIRNDPMLLECGIGFRNEPSYGNYSPSFNESNLGEVKHDFINFELTFSPRKELFNEVPGNTDPNAFSCEPSNSENGKTMVEMDKDFNESLAKVRPPEKEKKEVEKGKEKDIVDEVTTHEPSIPGIMIDHVVHEIEEDDNEKIDPPTLRREKELCKLDNLFQNMIHTYNESNYYQIGAFKLRRPLPLASFKIALFIFDFSLSLTYVILSHLKSTIFYV
ncbi:uncharacterized protein LOC133793532 [Humulus lupulus]|uniref:uncharacterized protein LOC133793532 n=1 Tax=Humulus lupulus TaxID=3486 RepID=UPI002B4027CF|nr:uncharacterized protein LOC133793532 [Humulus lupulus]